MAPSGRGPMVTVARPLDPVRTTRDPVVAPFHAMATEALRDSESVDPRRMLSTANHSSSSSTTRPLNPVTNRLASSGVVAGGASVVVVSGIVVVVVTASVVVVAGSVVVVVLSSVVVVALVVVVAVVDGASGDGSDESSDPDAPVVSGVVVVTGGRVVVAIDAVVGVGMVRRIEMSPLGGAVTVVDSIDVDRDSGVLGASDAAFAPMVTATTDTITIDPHMAMRLSRSASIVAPRTGRLAVSHRYGVS